MAGVPTIACIDWDEDSIKTLKANRMISGEKIMEDIREFRSDDFKCIIKKHDPEKLVVIGGPPCQPFSKAAYWIGNGARKIGNDPRNMIGEYIRIIKDLKPDGFVFENVESMLHPTNKKVVEMLMRTMRKLKYNYKLVHANALDYGVPQRRKRIFIIGSMSSIVRGEPLRTHAPPEFCNGNGMLPYEGVGEFISKYGSHRYSEREESVDGGKYESELKEIPPGKNYIWLSRHADHQKPRFIAGTRFWNFLLKLHPDEPSWTIPAQPGPWVGPFHWSSRRLRVPEIAAIQTFPNDYEFCGKRRSVQRQIGNAVPPLMGKAMVEFLKANI